MERLGILPEQTCANGASLRWRPISAVRPWYCRICRGIDEREVKPDRPYKSVSAERTFDEDLRDPERLAAELERIAGYAWDRVKRAEVIGRTVTLKVKFGDFTIITRSKSFAGRCPTWPLSPLPGRRCWPLSTRLSKGIRLLGLGLHNLSEVTNRPAPAGTCNLRRVLI